MRRNKAQSVVEYVVVILAIITALLVIGYYVKGGLSGKMREAADAYGGGEVYAPYYSAGHTVVTQ